MKPKEKIITLLDRGYTTTEIASIVNCSKAYVSQVKKKWQDRKKIEQEEEQFYEKIGSLAELTKLYKQAKTVSDKLTLTKLIQERKAIEENTDNVRDKFTPAERCVLHHLYNWLVLHELCYEQGKITDHNVSAFTVIDREDEFIIKIDKDHNDQVTVKRKWIDKDETERTIKIHDLKEAYWS